MLTKLYRLDSGQIFSIIKNGKKISGKYLYVKYLPSDAPTGLKCAIVVPKKFVANNVQRNLVKRWIRHAFLEAIKTNSLTLPGLTLVINIQGERDYSFANILKDLQNIMNIINTGKTRR